MPVTYRLRRVMFGVVLAQVAVDARYPGPANLTVCRLGLLWWLGGFVPLGSVAGGFDRHRTPLCYQSRLCGCGAFVGQSAQNSVGSVRACRGALGRLWHVGRPCWRAPSVG